MCAAKQRIEVFFYVKKAKIIIFQMFYLKMIKRTTKDMEERIAEHIRLLFFFFLLRLKAMPHVTISSTMDFNVAKIASSANIVMKSLYLA